MAHVPGRAPQKIRYVVNLPERLAEDRSALLDQEIPNFRRASDDDVADFEQHDLALGHQRRAPSGSRLMRGGDRLLHLVRAGLLHTGENIPGGRIDVFRDVVARGANPSAIDEQPVGRQPVNHVKSVRVHLLFLYQRANPPVDAQPAWRIMIGDEGANLAVAAHLPQRRHRLVSRRAERRCKGVTGERDR